MSRATLILAVAVVLAVYAGVATHRMLLPGIYMDEVNPDYLVAKVLNRSHADPLIAWVLPGNYLANRFPILVSLYHGLQHFWLGLPLYALFGMSVAGIRLTHIVFGMGVLAGMLILLQRARVPVGILVACGIALALDPAFVFAYRTQGYITLSPVMWLMLSIALLVQIGDTGERRSAWLWIASGVCYGFAVLGYFVYAFYFPVMLAWAWRAAASDGVARHAAWPVRLRWLGGVAFGCAYYAIGYALVARKVGGGVEGLVAYLADSSARLAAFSTTLSPAERVTTAASFVRAAMTNDWGHRVIFGAPQGTAADDGPRLALLVAMPVVLLAWTEVTRRPSPLLRALVALPIAFFAVSLLFGRRLGGHHYLAFVPIAYAALAVGAAAIRSSRAPARRAVGNALAALVFGALGVLNATALHREFDMLERTGGAGLHSDAINALASDVLALSPALVFYPDWGLSMPIVLISGGAVAAAEDVSVDAARRLLCRGRDVAIATVGNDAARFTAWARDLQWPPPRVRTYAQRDGVAVAQLGVYSGAERGAGACSMP